MRFHHTCSVLLLLASACGGGGGDEGTTNPPPATNTATFNGSVIDEERGSTPVAGAKVAVAGLTATTNAGGAFTLTGVPLGTQLVTVSAAGFDTTAWDFPIVTGTNVATIPVGPTNTYVETGNTLVYMPSGSATFRGAIVVVYGGTSDARPMLRGNITYYRDLPPAGDVSTYRPAVRNFAKTKGFVIVGIKTPFTGQTGQATAAEIAQGLTAAGTRSNHPELANVPLVLEGMSTGACHVNRVAAEIPSRTIGFVSMKSGGGCSFPTGSPAASVPAYYIIGSADQATINDPVIADFELFRARGAIWALTVEPGAGHVWSGFHDQIFNWIGVVANLRLPTTVTPGAAVALRAVTESSGWLGDRTSYVVAGFPCFAGDKPKASWLPSEATAREWQMIVRGSATTVNVCP